MENPEIRTEDYSHETRDYPPTGGEGGHPEFVGDRNESFPQQADFSGQQQDPAANAPSSAQGGYGRPAGSRFHPYDSNSRPRKPMSSGDRRPFKVKPCANGASCPFHARGLCSFLHEGEAAAAPPPPRPARPSARPPPAHTESSGLPTRPCSNGRDCKFLRAGRCTFYHSVEEMQAAGLTPEQMEAHQRGVGQSRDRGSGPTSRMPCMFGADCPHYRQGKCRYSHEPASGQRGPPPSQRYPPASSSYYPTQPPAHPYQPPQYGAPPPSSPYGAPPQHAYGGGYGGNPYSGYSAPAPIPVPTPMSAQPPMGAPIAFHCLACKIAADQPAYCVRCGVSGHEDFQCTYNPMSARELATKPPGSVKYCSTCGPQGHLDVHCPHLCRRCGARDSGHCQLNCPFVNAAAPARY